MVYYCLYIGFMHFPSIYQVAKQLFFATLLALVMSSKEMLTLPEGRPKQAAKFGVRNEEVAVKAYVAWRKEEAEIPGAGTSSVSRISRIK